MWKLKNLLIAYRDEEDGAALAADAMTFLVIVAVGAVGLSPISAG